MTHSVAGASAPTQPDDAVDANSGVLDAASPDAASPDAATPDTAMDDAGSEVELNGCAEGTLNCAAVRIHFTLNWLATPAQLVSTITGEGFSAQARSDRQGVATVTLPIGRPLWVHVPAGQGVLTTHAPLLVAEARDYPVGVFDELAVNEWHAGLGASYDSTKSLAVAIVELPRIAGTGVEINRPRERAIITTSEPATLPGNVILADTNGRIAFMNVEPGPAVPTWISPPGWACSGPFDAAYRYEPGAVTYVSIACRPLAASAVELAALRGIELFPVSTPIDVCFMEGSATARLQVRFAIEGTWGAATQLNFSGWGSCPSGMDTIAATTVPIRLTSGSGGTAAAGHRARLALDADAVPEAGNVNRAQMRVGVDGSAERIERVAIHEFGHVLGIFQEHRRPHSPRCPEDDDGGPTTCADNTHCAPNVCGLLGPRSGDPSRPFFCIDGNDATAADLSLVTPYDDESVSNDCSTGNPVTLSAWDVFAAQQLYGRRSSEIVPLFTTYNDVREDFATGTWESFRGPGSADAAYPIAYMEGWLFNVQVPDTVPLDLYFHAGRGDYVLVANDATRRNAEVGGYVRLGTHGYVYRSPRPGTVPLMLMWHPGREDNYTAALDGRGFAAAEALGYERAWVEGHVFVPDELPYHVTWRYHHPGWGDHLVAIARSQLAINAVNAGYQRQSLDMLTLRYEVAGTLRLNQYWNEATLDHAALTSPTPPPGFTWIGHEGFVFANGTSLAGGAPVRLLWNEARGDHFTTVERAGQSGSGYVEGADQGVTLRLNNIGD